MVCRECKQVKVREFQGKISSKGRKINVDGTGRQWYGEQCPDCRYAPKMKTFVPKRKCRKCNKKLPPTRYFDCEECKQVLPSDDLMLLGWNLSGVLK